MKVDKESRIKVFRLHRGYSNPENWYVKNCGKELFICKHLEEGVQFIVDNYDVFEFELKFVGDGYILIARL